MTFPNPRYSSNSIASVSEVTPSAIRDDNSNAINQQLHVGIIGGGVAGSTIAIRLAALGVQVTLLENKSSLIDGPPMCHLHAGGNLYREISDDDAVLLLKQSIDILRLYPYSMDVRPTVIAVPQRDAGSPDALIPRLKRLTDVYRQMVKDDPDNKVLGEPDDYYRLYDHAQMQALAQQYQADNTKKSGELNNTARAQNAKTSLKSMDDWVAAAADQLDLDKLKYPVIAVWEYGWNIFRLAASAQRALTYYPSAQVMLNAKVEDVTPLINGTEKGQSNSLQWQIVYHQNDSQNQQQDETTSQSISVDYLINASGFRTGLIDDMAKIKSQRMVEFKTSYISHWPVDQADNETSKAQHFLPEIIIHGERGSPQGMIQLTPYSGGYYQIHSMSKQATLFVDGLVASSTDSAQPQLNPTYLSYIDKGWEPAALKARNQVAINDVSQFVPRFASAKPRNNALFGGQQIPGVDDSLRVADVSVYPDKRYARAENVKASSALVVADNLVKQLISQGLLIETEAQKQNRLHHHWIYLSDTNKQDMDNMSRKLAEIRYFPIEMADVITSYL